MQKLFLTTLLCVSTALTGCVIQPVNAPDSPEQPDVGMATELVSGDRSLSGAYTLKSFDPLYISFAGISDQPPLEIVIDENGEITLLHVNDPIMAAGLTTSALEKKIEKLYVDGGIYKNVSVNVTMTAKTFYVQGQVNNPTQYPLSSGTTLIQAIAGASGYTAFAWKSKVTISRHGKVYKFNMKDLEEDPSKDVKIEAGDVIKVPQKPW